MTFFFTQHNVFEILFYYEYWWLIPFVTQQYYIPQFIYPLSMTMGCFQLGAVMNKATVNTHIQVFLWTYVYIFISLWEILRNGTAGSYFKCMLHFKGKSQTISKVAVPFCISHNNM